MVPAKSRLLLAPIFALAGCAAAAAGEGGDARPEAVDGSSATATAPVRGASAPPVPAERALFAEVLGPLPVRGAAVSRREAPRGDAVSVRITVAPSAGRPVESVTAALPQSGEPVVVRSPAGSGWSVALAVAPAYSDAPPSLRVVFDVSWTVPDGPPRFPALPMDAPRDAVQRDGSAGEVQFALQGTLTSGLRSFRVIDVGESATLAVIPVGQVSVTFTLAVEPRRLAAPRADAVACEDHLAATLRQMLGAGRPANPGRDVRTIELVHEGGDAAGFVCGTDATPGSQFTSARPAGEFSDGPRFAAADLSAPGSAAYLVRDAAWVTDYELRDGRVAPVVTRRRSGFAWLRHADGLTDSESVVIRSTTPRPVTLADGRTLWADVLRVEGGPRAVTSVALDPAFEADPAPRSRGTRPADGR